MEANTYATSIFIGAPRAQVQSYLSDGASLSEYTLFSRMQERVDDATWLGTASGYQAGLYYHVKRRDVGAIQIVEWHCGAQYGAYFHVYPMLLLEPSYFENARELGTYYHWVSFVDPARRTQMIKEGLPTVHRSEARSLKAQLERRNSHAQPVAAELELRSHSIYINAPLSVVAATLSDQDRAFDWGYLMRRTETSAVDEYDQPIRITLRLHDLGEYQLIEHDTTYLSSGHVVRTPIMLIPAAYAFAQPNATGVIMHRISAWPLDGRKRYGKQSPDDYDTEAINAKRIIEAQAGNLTSYALGCSYLG